MLNKEIASIKITESKVKRIIKKIIAKIETLETEIDSYKQLKIIDDINKLRNKYLTLYWASYIGYLKNIKDKKYLTSEKTIGKYDGSYNNAVYKMYEVIDNLPTKDHLIKKYGERFLNIAHNQKILLSNNEDIFEKEMELRRQYRKILNNIRVNLNDEELSLVRLNKYLISDDENLRKSSYDKRYNALLEVSNELGQVFQELLQVRSEIAKSSNFKNYTDYSYIKMNRIDYTKKELKAFKENIIKYFVPLKEKLKQAQAKRLGEETLSYYNSSYLFKDGNAKTKYELTGIVDKLQEIFHDINKDYGTLFKLMIDHNLVDLEERENKSAGGITTFLPDFKIPIFIKRFIDNSSNFIAITHEFGHSLQLYLNKEKLLHENRWPTFDICEIHSITMELLVSDYVERIYKEDTPKHLITHYTNLIETLIRTATIDDFATEIYSKDIKNPNEVNNIWKKIYIKYYPSNNYDLDYFKKGILWQTDINRIDDPFYGIDYALATIYALSFYQKYSTSKDKAIESFTEFCKDGGEISFKEIAAKYNLLSPFNEQDLITLSRFLEEKLKSITTINFNY